jgi:23S rRNA (cytidine1920-2'-O)/16S rRNA (cytidine1409-2'-O)-methyltransferase
MKGVEKTLFIGEKRAVRKDRLDALMFNRGMCDSREQAKRLVLAGEVKVDGRLVDKPADRFGEDAVVEIKEKPKFVGRGGLKLEGALDEFGIDVMGWVCLDVGASTGGFTDCLLQRGAARVHAIDVGTNQLVWKLRNDPRVISKEKFNARHLDVDHLGERVRLAVMDLSFISLTKVLPAVFGVLEEGGDVVCLIKPQFELEREDVGKGGIVREEELRQRAVEKIRLFVTGECGKAWKGVIPSRIAGMDGNQEFLAWIGQKDFE